MNKFFNLSKEQQRMVIVQTSSKTALAPEVIEKDLWVTVMLQLVFALPYSDKLIFKGGTSLSKIWHIIERFSEDIDLALDYAYFGLEGDFTIKKIKKLRKQSSSFVRDTVCKDLRKIISDYGIQECKVVAEEDGSGDGTYPEPRKIFIFYPSLFEDKNESPYLLPQIILEIGARSLVEPASQHKLKSLISENLDIDCTIIDTEITTALPEKTFLEKAFLLHELFSIDNPGVKNAERRSRHLYDLEKMMDMGFALRAVSDDELWNMICQHREVFTRVKGVDYTPDVRKRICLTPPEEVTEAWRADYKNMQDMIYGTTLSFDELLKRMKILEERFHIGRRES